MAIQSLIFSLALVAYSATANDWLNVEITGANNALTRNINAHLGTLPTSDVQRRAFVFNAEDNIDAALHSLGYYHANVHQQLSSPEKGVWTLSITVKPGEPTTLQWVDIQLSGEILQDAVVNRWLLGLNVKPGDILNHGVYEEIKSQLLTIALARGYFDGKYSANSIVINRDLNTAQITLHYDSGPRYHIGQVTFEGDSLVDGFLDQLIPFEPRTTYSTKKLGDLNRELIDTGYFTNIKVLPQLDKIEGQAVPIKVGVTDRPSHSFEIGVGAEIGNSSNSGIEPRLRLTWRTPQVNQYGHSQETSLEWSPDRPKFLTTYTIPLTHPLDDQLKLRVGILRDKYGVTQVYDPNKRDYINTGELESTKATAGVVRQKRFDNNWLFTYSIDGIKEAYTQRDVDYNTQMVLLGSSLSKTHRGDNSLDPKSGFFQHYSLEYADPNLGSDIRLTRLQAKFKWIDTFFEKHRIVSRLDLAANIAAESDLANIPPSLRYFAGGDQSIRGYSYQELGPYIDYTNSEEQLARMVVGGRYLMVGSLEYQYYVTPTWRVATFVDAGNAFDVDQIEPIVAVGGGIHWISPIGPIKLDLGVGLKETETVDRSWRIHLTMGAEL
ncbi:autotransporter assembly complex protein TamA [Shewanella colwelliana]|nr:autotransporter assembly complex family protein [Shewanella colwelliana]MCZ4336902.1 autotransporter assembly complex protein TamA [Shewanella colwelliana]